MDVRQCLVEFIRMRHWGAKSTIYIMYIMKLVRLNSTFSTVGLCKSCCG